MNSLSRQTTEHLIQSLEAGEIDHTEAAKRIAQLHTANTENYAQTLIVGIIIAGLSWAVTGGSIIIPAAIAFLTWESYSSERRDRLQAFKDISQGQILEYLPDEERELFETLLAKKPTEQRLQNPEAQGAPRTQDETFGFPFSLREMGRCSVLPSAPNPTGRSALSRDCTSISIRFNP